MANRYWVGGNANWDATVGTKWSTTSGGAGGSAVPLASDDVFLDNGAGTGNVTIAANVVCRSLNCTGYVGTLTYDTSTRTLTIGDATAGASNIALKFVAGMTYTILGNTNTMTFNYNNTTTQTVTWGGKTAPNVTFIGSAGKWQIQDAFIANTVSFTSTGAAVLDINGQTCTWNNFSGVTGTAKTLTLGSAAIAIGTDWAWRSGQTITANSATVTQTGAASNFDVNAVSGMNYNGMSLIQTGSGIANVGISTGTAITLANYTRTGTAATTAGVEIGCNVTCTGTIRLDGNSIINRLVVQSDLIGTARTLTAATMSASTDNVDFIDITGAGAANWNLSAKSSGDGLGNSGITFTTPVTRYAIMTANRNWSDTAMWSASSGGATGASAPICHDDVIFDNNTTGAIRVVTMDMVRACKNLSTSVMTNFTVSFARVGAGFNTAFFGNADMTALTAITGANWTVYFAGRSSLSFTPPTGTITPQTIFQGIGGTYTLTRALTVSTNSNLGVLAGGFDTAGFNISSETFNSATTTYARSVTLGTSTVTLAGFAATSTWSVAAANLTLSAASSIIIYNVAGASTRTFGGAGLTYGTFTYTVAGSTGGLDITGSNTFSTINFSDVTNARTLRFTAATTTTINTAFNVNGTSGKLMTIGSVTASSHTIAMPTGISCDYLSISRSTLTGNSAYAGANSTDGGNNSTSPGWIFTAPPAVTTGGFFSLMQLGLI